MASLAGLNGISLPSVGSSMDPEDGKTYCVRQGTFARILPLEDMASLTIGGVTIPIE